MLAAPVSFVGAIGLLWVTRTQLNVSSLMGLILLIGLIVKNGIILLDFTDLAHARERRAVWRSRFVTPRACACDPF